MDQSAAETSSRTSPRIPQLMPVRRARMSESPFAFFRGAVAMMAHDLARSPTAGHRVQICGDAHLSNFGVFAGRDRGLVLDLNDFDETSVAPSSGISSDSRPASFSRATSVFVTGPR